MIIDTHRFVRVDEHDPTPLPSILLLLEIMPEEHSSFLSGHHRSLSRWHSLPTSANRSYATAVPSYVTNTAAAPASCLPLSCRPILTPSRLPPSCCHGRGSRGSTCKCRQGDEVARPLLLPLPPPSPRGQEPGFGANPIPEQKQPHAISMLLEQLLERPGLGHARRTPAHFLRAYCAQLYRLVCRIFLDVMRNLLQPPHLRLRGGRAHGRVPLVFGFCLVLKIQVVHVPIDLVPCFSCPDSHLPCSSCRSGTRRRRHAML